jgi:hypothetical protein
MQYVQRTEDEAIAGMFTLVLEPLLRSGYAHERVAFHAFALSHALAKHHLGAVRARAYLEGLLEAFDREDAQQDLERGAAAASLN